MPQDFKLKPNKSKKIVIIVGIVIAVIIGILSIFVIKNILFKLDIKNCEKIPEDYGEISKYECFSKVAIKWKKPKVFENLQDTNLKNRFYHDIAMNLTDISICNKISTEYDREVCYSRMAEKTKSVEPCKDISSSLNLKICYTNVAVLMSDINICDNIQNLTDKERCFFSIAESNKNYSICEKITDTRIKNSCFLTVGLERRDCENIDEAETVMRESARDVCFSDKAIEEKNPELCENITDSRIKRDCKTYSGAPNIIDCENISTDHKRKGCIQNIIKITNEPEECDKLKETYDKENCYYFLTFEFDDPSYCTKITNQELRDNCFKYRAIKEKDPEMCGNIQNADIEKECKIISGTTNITDCEKIPPSRLDCIENSIGITKDPAECEQLREIKDKDSCYHFLAKVVHNPSFCDKLVNQNLKVTCIYYANLEN